MSWAVVRGAPTAAQEHLNAVRAAAAAAQATPAPPAALSLPQLLHYCLRTNPDFVFMTNGATGVRSTNQEILRMAVGLARALRARGLAGRRALLAARDHERCVAAYLALLFAGVVPFMTDPASTKLELKYYLELVEPSLVLCDAAALDVVRRATEPANGEKRDAPFILPIHTEDFLEYMKGHGDNIDDFRVADSDPLQTLLLLPTSGSTGMPKAARLDSRGLMEQLASPWMHCSQMPPTERAMVLTTPQWVTFTAMVTTCIVYQIELLMSPEVPTVEHVLHMMETYKPSWTFFGPPFAKQLAAAASARHFASLRTVISLGSKAPPDLLPALKEKMPASSDVRDAYGMTEVQGYIAQSGPGAPLGCCGPVTNVLHYKLVKENGEEAAIGEEGELYIKGNCIIQGYLNNESELAESSREGWLRTGDVFAEDAARRLYYRRRIKFSFKYNNQLVSPEQIEGLVMGLPYVAECVVCDSERGPAAAVVLRPGAPAQADAREEIHDLVTAQLSDHKRLRGGIVFVAQLPRTHSGKLRRPQCRDMLRELLAAGASR